MKIKDLSKIAIDKINAMSKEEFKEKLIEHGYKKYIFDYCYGCECWMTVCGFCGNNSCNAMRGQLPDGSDCKECDNIVKIEHDMTNDNLIEVINMLQNIIKTNVAPSRIFVKKTFLNHIVKTLETKTISRKKASELVVRDIKELLN